MERRKTLCPLLKVNQMRQTEGIGERIWSKKRCWKTEHSKSISTDFTGGDVLNSVAYELYDLLDLGILERLLWTAQKPCSCVTASYHPS